MKLGDQLADLRDRDRDAQVHPGNTNLEELGQVALNLVLASSYWKVKMFNLMGQVINWIGWMVNFWVLNLN